MAEQGSNDLSAIQVCVRARPLNERERTEGHRECVSFDEPTKQVVVTAVDKNTLLQLRGSQVKGYAFDKRYGADAVSDNIYDDCIFSLVDSCFKGYNATVLAYGQTGSGKTHTMSGGVGIHGKKEEGVTPRVIRHLFAVADQLNKKAKPGEKTEITACALELYNEDLLDLSNHRSGRDEVNTKNGWDPKGSSSALKLQERPVGKDGRVVPEVVGVKEVKVKSADDLRKFYDDCMVNRSTGSTKLNDRSSRSHAIFTVGIHRVAVEVTGELNSDFKAKVRTTEYTSKLHLVDLAGSERVKRSGATGKELKEASHINSGLLALGNVIVALANENEAKKRGHIPYRDSKLTRLLQDSLGGNSLTILISCISPSEMDFEETNNTLKYANRACSIKNTPLPNNYQHIDIDLPSIPAGAVSGMGLVQITALLEDVERQREIRERREREKRERELKNLESLRQMREARAKIPGYQRLRAAEYDWKRKQLAQAGYTTFAADQVISEDLKSFGPGRRMHLHQSMDFMPSANARFARRRPGVGSASEQWTPSRQPMDTSNMSQEEIERAQAEQEAFFQQEDGEGADFIVADDAIEYEGTGVEDDFIAADDDELTEGHDFEGGADTSEVEAKLQQAITLSKNKFRRDLNRKGKSGSAGGGLAEGDQDAVITEEVDEEEEGGLASNIIQEKTPPKLLARFKVNTRDILAVYKAISKEDFQDVISLLPENTPLPASEKMTYLLARLEMNPDKDMDEALKQVANEEINMNEAIGPAVGCLMATFGTNMISSCIFDFEDPPELQMYGVDERIELWGLQIPHHSARPPLEEAAKEGEKDGTGPEVTPWTSIDRLNMSIGLLYALCAHAEDHQIKCGFCVPRPQLLKRWLQAGVSMQQISTPLRLIYPPSAHDYEYYKASTVAYFMIREVREGLQQKLSIVA